MEWCALTIGVLGGDEREQEIVRLAALTGAEVRAYGFPWPMQGIPGVTRASDPEGLVRGARYLLLPVPGLGDDGSVYAPSAPTPIYPTRDLLALLSQGAHVILGRADDRLREAAASLAIGLSEYEDNRELMHLRAPAIVEGALQLAIEHTRVTIHSAAVAVVGHGTIGSLLARTLRVLGARVHVAARNPAQRAAAYAAGAETLEIAELADLAPRFSILFSTVPARVVGQEVLGRLPTGALVMDLAAPPGSVDLAAAKQLGLETVWARGLGRCAPVTVGASQWAGVRRRIEEIEESGA
jgi:dipicolinate synthase subunit A